MRTLYEELLERKQREHGSKFDASDLDLRFVSAFNNGTRIKIEWCGETHFGRVGVTTGWKPVFRCIGSGLILGPSATIVAVKRGRRYATCAA